MEDLIAKERLRKLKEEKFVTKRIFGKISENMHYEIFKYLNARNLLEIRNLSLGGYQLVANRILRSRINNYFHHIKFTLFTVHSQLNVRHCNILFEQTGKNKISFEGQKFEHGNFEKFIEILNTISEITEINFSRLYI